MNDLLRLKSLEYVRHYEEDGILIVEVRNPSPKPMPCCLIPRLVKNGSRLNQRYRDEPNRRQTVKLKIDRQKYWCRECEPPMSDTLSLAISRPLVG